MVDAGEDSAGLWKLLNEGSAEWAVFGCRIQAKIVLLEPRELDEVAIKRARGTWINRFPALRLIAERRLRSTPLLAAPPLAGGVLGSVVQYPDALRRITR